MKKVVISIVLSFTFLLTFGQTQETMVIKKNDGTTLRVNVNDINCVVFENTNTNGEGEGGNDQPTPSVPENYNLVGVWEAIGEQVKSVYTFTESELTIDEYYLQQDGSWKLSEDNSSKSAYTLKDGMLSYILTGTYYDQTQQKEVQWTEAVEVQVKLLYNKTALALLSSWRDQNIEEYNLNQILYKKGATIPAKIEDIQGDWRWYMHGDKTYTRVAVQIKENNMTLIIVPWGQRYDGTITYQNGYINLTVTAAYTSRGNSQGEGWGEGSIDPETLQATWTTLDRDSWLYYELNQMPFIANGNEAYGILANLPGVYIKQ